ncbi:MAG TPA: type II toxin-antitoxin system PemK/MazF family toxin, partial [Defluviitaleaceae bacterium]|nr:type II toxin-antitoxin system PemK/MazF family toxin [Defluviitaleaceae bacterium]
NKKLGLGDLKEHLKFENHEKCEEKQEIVNVKRGEIYMADLLDFMIYNSNITNGDRPVLIIQNQKGNECSNNVIVAKITSTQKLYPMHMEILLKKPSIIQFEQLMTIPKSKLKYKMGELNPEQIDECNRKLMLSVGLDFYNISGIEVMAKNTYTDKEEREETTYDVKIKTWFDETTVKIPLLDLVELGVTSTTKLVDVEKRLDCIKGLKILSIAVNK